MKSEQINIPAILGRELRAVLVAHNLDQAVTKRSALCGCCGKEVGWDDIAALIINGANIGLICDRPGCLEQAATQSCE